MTCENLANIDQVDTLSELFVAWDETVREAEDRVAKVEREEVERRRLGYL